MFRRTYQFLPFAAVAAVASVFVMPAKAAQINDTHIDVFKQATTNGDFIAGSGNAGDRFIVNSTPELVGTGDISVAIKPRNRDTGEPDSVAGNVYTVQAGQAVSNPARPELAFDIQFSPGHDNTSNYQLRLSVDFDPGPGTAYSVTQLPIHGVPGPAWDQTDGYFLSGTGGGGYAGGWNDPLVPYVISNTTNLSFLAAPPGFTYDSSAFGDYEAKLEVLDPTGTNVLTSVDTIAHVVPEPSNLAMLGIGGASLLLRRGRRR